MTPPLTAHDKTAKHRLFRHTGKIEMRRRNNHGLELVELAVAIFAIFFFVVFPLLDLATLWMGVNSVSNAARCAAGAAGKGATYLFAQTKANETASALSTGGVKIKLPVTVKYWQVPITKKTLPGADKPLERAQIFPPVPDETIDTTLYFYQTQVTVTGSVTPLVTLSNLKGIFGNIPGVTEPLVYTAISTAHCEQPVGLGL